MLIACDIGKQVGSKILLQDISIGVKPGEVLAILGPNGAGKSTLLKILSGELTPDTGEVNINTRPQSSLSSRQLARLRAVLPQDATLSFPFRVQEVVMIGRSPHRGAGVEADMTIVDQCLQAAEVLHLADRDYTTLSGGERQRVQLARVLAQIWDEHQAVSRYLLLDEPTSALDLMHQHHTFSVARHLARQQNIGVVTILHDLNLAALYADRVSILKQGRLLYSGIPTDVLRAEHIEAAFNIPATVMSHPTHSNCPLVIANSTDFKTTN